MTIERLSTPEIALLREDIYVVLSEQQTMGFVHKVGNVFVALSGGDLGRACEVGQSLSWDEAVAMVRRSWRAVLQTTG
jgi:hypothetical protein